MKHPIVAVTGASGALYGVRLLRELIRQGREPHVIVSPPGRQVLATELGSGSLKELLGSDGFREEQVRDFASPLASGSFETDGMVIVPCSMGTLGSIASGVSQNLIHRAAEVTLKERRRLILVPRETPFSQIALKNMLTLSQAGADILPANPGFYHAPASVEELVDFVVARILDLMGIPHTLSRRWTGLPVLKGEAADAVRR
ncbi:MAG: aromatic acid decarboxylase [Candidatus Omnitrophica bacterium CG11_big_fil_rev_8_21_14_0_20_64_10]|nr:MAG: aromatic acid decarboxylase [Candidatus Omnitrophica bacterium CG11_big_fil_rev_8_21_14_0_20_64_10]